MAPSAVVLHHAQRIGLFESLSTDSCEKSIGFFNNKVGSLSLERALSPLDKLHHVVRGAPFDQSHDVVGYRFHDPLIFFGVVVTVIHTSYAALPVICNSVHCLSTKA